jgi:hypothetical protein
VLFLAIVSAACCRIDKRHTRYCFDALVSRASRRSIIIVRRAYLSIAWQVFGRDRLRHEFIDGLPEGISRGDLIAGNARLL